MIKLQELPGLWSDWRNRQAARDERHANVDAIVAGNYGVFDSDEQSMLNASPNFIETALSDTAEAASLMPTVRCSPDTTSDLQRNRAAEMERIGVAYMGAWGADLLIPQTVRYLAKYGLGVWIVWPDFEQRMPLLEQRDPRTCYPEPGYRTGDRVRRCMFTRDVYLTSLPPEHLEKVAGWFAQQRNGPKVTRNTTVTLVEWFDEDEYVLAAMMAVASPLGAVSSSVRYVPVELERIPNRFDHVPVILGARIADGEYVGQFDQVLDLQRAHVRLSSLALDYADQAVYSDVWVRDLIGELSFGGGGFIELGPNGAIGRVPPATSSMNVPRDLQQLEQGLHMGARWPQSRPGEISQSIASAKFLESAAGMMNTAIRTYHLILSQMFSQALQVAMEIDLKLFPGKKTVSGVLRNQHFLMDYDASNIELKNRMRAEYGIGLGRTAAESAVLAIQYAQNGLISQELVQESIEGVTDISRERSRIDTEKLQGLLFAKMLQDVQAGTIDDRALIEILRARRMGEDLVAIYEKYVLEPKEQAMQTPLAPPGAMQPGMPMGVQPPQGQPPVPQAPQPSQMTQRMIAGDRNASIMALGGA